VPLINRLKGLTYQNNEQLSKTRAKLNDKKIMPQNQVGDAATIIQLLIVVVTICVAFANALFFFILRGIRKDISDLRTESKADHDDITKIKAKIGIED
jgi:hypothetical protein